MANPTLIVAVDPGFGGAIAFLRDGKDLEIHDMPCLELTRNGKAKKVLNVHEVARIRAPAVRRLLGRSHPKVSRTQCSQAVECSTSGKIAPLPGLVI